MNRRQLLSGAAASAVSLGGLARAATRRRPPNFIVVLCDDLGYGDLSVYNPTGIKTPAIERMAAEGCVLTDYYAPANLCTPSRAGLLTGRYPVRTGLGYEVLRQDDDRGLPTTELTIAGALKRGGYATALFGKWHLGVTPASWPPTKHGFDAFFGIPYSHDMAPLALYESHAASDATIKTPVDYPQLQEAFYVHAERFIEANGDKPFFVELALSAPHLPEHPHPPFEGKSFAGPYGAVVLEIDSIVDRLLSKLRALKLDRDTLVIFTSDNGPWFEGSSGGLRERKGGGGYDGGYRVPCICWAPGLIPAGSKSNAAVMGIDFLPTFVSMAALKPVDVTLDGRDITRVFTEGAATPHEALVLFDNETPIAIRTQDWKYVTAAYYRGLKLPYALLGYEELYDLKADPSESYSVATVHPQVLAEMKAKFAAAKATFAPFKHAEAPKAYRALNEQLRHMQD